jgi:acetylornithine deacetylase/succinyl-diaminopimelate desuccinylase-like protein
MATTPALPPIDWDAVADEATRLLADYLRIDTSNPPGNEYLACDWLEGVLRAEGFECERFDPGEGRHSLRAVYHGDGSKRPLILLNHTDVVPAEPDRWEEPPFGGVIRDGVLWGRGALDMKGLGVMMLVTILLFRRLGIASRRDLVFLATPDEEAGGAWGVEWLAREHPGLMTDAEYVLNEGAYGTPGFLGMDRPVFGFTTSEKGPYWLHLTAEGTAGFGGTPIEDNSVATLVRAVHRVLEWKRPFEVRDAIRPLWELLKKQGVVPEAEDQETLAAVAARGPQYNAMLIDTICPTMLDAGYKTNVIPTFAKAVLDCRLLPGTDPEGFKAALEGVIDDPRVRIEVELQRYSKPSANESEVYRVFQEVVREAVEDALFTPVMEVGFTDSVTFRNLGIEAFGFCPALVSLDEVANVHGHNERISLENLRMGCQLFFEVVRRLCV